MQREGGEFHQGISPAGLESLVPQGFNVVRAMVAAALLTDRQRAVYYCYFNV